MKTHAMRVVLGFGAGWALSGILDSAGAPPWLRVAVSVLALVLMIWGAQPEPRPILAEPTQPDDETLRTWMEDLKRHDLTLTTREVAQSFRAPWRMMPNPLHSSGCPAVWRDGVTCSCNWIDHLRKANQAAADSLGEAMKRREATEASARAGRALGECGVIWGADIDCQREGAGERGQHACVAPVGHEREDDFPHGCHCGATQEPTSLCPLCGLDTCGGHL